jgi:hypothetical protein
MCPKFARPWYLGAEEFGAAHGVDYRGAGCLVHSLETGTRLRYFSHEQCRGLAVEYRVIWEIDIDAENAKQAAEEARALQLRTDPSVTIFDIWDYQRSKMHRIDLAGETNCLRRAELTELRAELRMLQCGPGLPENIRDIASVMLIFLDKEQRLRGNA